MAEAGVALDPAIARDTRPLLELPSATLRLANDERWPWLILMPRDAAATELHHLAPAERAAFLDVVSATSATLQRASGCRSVNVAMLGNVVAQLHCHVVARSPGDPNWPAPIWGHGTPSLRPHDAPLPAFAREVVAALTAERGDATDGP